MPEPKPQISPYAFEGFIGRSLPLLFGESPQTMMAPTNPQEAIKSRRDSCYGLAVVAYMEQFPDSNQFLAEIRDDINGIVDLATKSSQYSKVKSLHAAVAGSAPYITLEDYTASEFYKNKERRDEFGDKEFLCHMEQELQEYLRTEQPILMPVSLEFKNGPGEDGTVLARYKWVPKTPDERPLVSLKQRLDPQTIVPAWDPNNRLRETTVAVSLCVADVRDEPLKAKKIKEILAAKSECFRQKGELSINKFTIVEYDKRTLTQKRHTQTIVEVVKPLISYADLIRLTRSSDLYKKNLPYFVAESPSQNIHNIKI